MRNGQIQNASGPLSKQPPNGLFPDRKTCFDNFIYSRVLF